MREGHILPIISDLLPVDEERSKFERFVTREVPQDGAAVQIALLSKLYDRRMAATTR